MANNYRKNKRRKNKRRIMRSLTIKELSGVDEPAQEGATATIMKRADDNPEEALILSVERGDFTGVVDTLTTTGVNIPFISTTDTVTKVENCSFTFQDEMEKLVILTSEDEGHQHAIRFGRYELEEMGGITSYQGGDDESHHSHDFVIEPDGSITIGMANGHMHEAEISIMERLQMALADKRKYPKKYDDEKSRDKKSADSGKSLTETEKQMDENEVQALIDAALAKSKEESDAALAVAKSYGELTDVQKAHFSELDEVSQNAFLGMTPEQRQSAVDNEIAKREAADPVVYTADDGTEYRESDDSRLVKMAQERDQDRRDIQKMRDTDEQNSLEKRASQLNNLPGTLEDKVAMVKAIDGIEDADVRQRNWESLVSQNTQMAKAFETVGHRDGSTASTGPEAEIESLVKARMTETGEDYANAYTNVLSTPQGAELYSKSVQQ
jgi:hypothetical protein